MMDDTMTPQDGTPMSDAPATDEVATPAPEMDNMSGDESVTTGDSEGDMPEDTASDESMGA